MRLGKRDRALTGRQEEDYTSGSVRKWKAVKMDQLHRPSPTYIGLSTFVACSW